jgi:putative modified peptide
VAHGKVIIKCWATKARADELFRKLASDEEFRRRVEKDPVGELYAYGIELSGPGVPSTAKLADRDEIQALREAMADDDDPLGRTHGTWCFHLICVVFKFGALPFIQRDAVRDGAP